MRIYWPCWKARLVLSTCCVLNFFLAWDIGELVFPKCLFSISLEKIEIDRDETVAEIQDNIHLEVGCSIVSIIWVWKKNVDLQFFYFPIYDLGKSKFWDVLLVSTYKCYTVSTPDATWHDNLLVLNGTSIHASSVDNNLNYNVSNALLMSFVESRHGGRVQCIHGVRET